MAWISALLLLRSQQFPMNSPDFFLEKNPVQQGKNQVFLAIEHHLQWYKCFIFLLCFMEVSVTNINLTCDKFIYSVGLEPSNSLWCWPAACTNKFKLCRFGLLW